MTPDVSRRLPPDADIEGTDAPGQAAVRQSSLNRLATLLRIADGAWAMAVYRSTAIRSQMIDELTVHLAPLPVVNLALVDRPARLFEYLRDLPPDAPPVALMCYAYGDGLPALLRSLDLQRDALARLPHRLVFWVNSYERGQFLELAPNFASRLSGTFQFPGESLAGAPPLAPAALPRTGGGESGASTARRRPLLSVRSARHRDEQIDYLRRRIRDLQQLPRRDDEAIGDAWYDLAGLLESGEPRRWAEAEAAYAEAARAYAAAGEALAEAEARYCAGDAARRAYLPQAALDHLHRALHLYRILTDTPQTTRTAVLGEANVLQAQGDVLAFLDQREEALARYDQALALFRTVGDRLGEANVLKAQGDVLAFLDQREEALARYDQALALFRTVGARLGEANVLKAQGDVLYFLKQTEEALARYDQALALFRTVGARLGEANVLKAQGDVLAFLDQREEALARYDQALALFRTVGDRLGEANVLKAQGDVLAFLDQWEEALARYDQALALFRTVGDRLGEANVLKAQGDVHRLARMFAAAHAAYDDALRLYRQTGSRQGEANVYLGLARTTLAEGNGAEAQSWAERAIALHTANQSRFDVALDCETLAMACKDAGDFEGGIAALRKAAQLYTDIGLVERANHVRTRLGSWLDEAERLDESVSVYLDAVQLQPDAAWLRRNYADSLIKVKQLAEAAEQLYRAEQLEPDAPYLALRRAELAKASGDRAAARQWAAEALLRRADWDEARDILDWGDANAAT